MAPDAADPPEPGLAGRVLVTIVIAIGVAVVLAALAAFFYAAYVGFTTARATTDGGVWPTLHMLFLAPVLTFATILDWILPTTWFATIIDQRFEHPLALVIGIHVFALISWYQLVGSRD